MKKDKDHLWALIFELSPSPCGGRPGLSINLWTEKVVYPVFTYLWVPKTENEKYEHSCRVLRAGSVSFICKPNFPSFRHGFGRNPEIRRNEFRLWACRNDDQEKEPAKKL